MKLPAIRQLPSGSWFCRLRIDGRDTCITEPTRELCQAKAMAYKTGILQLRANPRRILLRDACEQYIKDREGVRSETTLEGYRWIIRNLFPSQMSRQIGDITEKSLSRAVQLERQRTTRLGKPVSPKSIKNAVAFVTSVLRDNGIELGPVTAPGTSCSLSASTIRLRLKMLSTEPTDVPPNFITFISAVRFCCFETP